MADVLTHNQAHSSPQEALLHYGVKGMKWGVRNKDDEDAGTDRAGGDSRGALGPVGGSRSPQKQAKIDDKVANLRAAAAKADVAAKEWHSSADSRPKTFMGNYQASEDRKMARNNEIRRDSLNKTAEAVEQRRMTPTQKKLLIGGAIVGGVVLANYGASKFGSGEAQAMIARGKSRLRGKPFEFDRDNELAYAASPDQVISKVLPRINPNYGEPGGQMNCRRCTFAYEMRRRGFNVDATTSPVGWGQSETGLINALTPGQRNINRVTSLSQMVVNGAQNIRTKASGDTRSNLAERMSVPDGSNRKSVFDAINTQPAGARGEAVFNFGAFGHSLAYEKFHDGSIHIFDSQKGKSYNLGHAPDYESFITKWGGFSAIKNVEVTRLDNMAIDHKFIGRWVRNSSSTTATRTVRTTSSTSSRPSKPPGMTEANWLTMRGQPATRPADMHITEWNRIRREAGLT